MFGKYVWNIFPQDISPHFVRQQATSKKEKKEKRGEKPKKRPKKNEGRKKMAG